MPLRWEAAALRPMLRATLRTQAGDATLKAPGVCCLHALPDVVDQPFAYVLKDRILHSSDLLGETLT